jgi:hypothetical protein
MQSGSEPWIPDKQLLEIYHCRSETILLTPNSSCEACSAYRGRDGHYWPPPAQIQDAPD